MQTFTVTELGRPSIRPVQHRGKLLVRRLPASIGLRNLLGTGNPHSRNCVVVLCVALLCAIVSGCSRAPTWKEVREKCESCERVTIRYRGYHMHSGLDGSEIVIDDPSVIRPLLSTVGRHVRFSVRDPEISYASEDAIQLKCERGDARDHVSVTVVGGSVLGVTINEEQYEARLSDSAFADALVAFGMNERRKPK